MKLFAFLKSFLVFLLPFRFNTFYPKYINTVLSVQAEDSPVVNQFNLLALIYGYVSLHVLYLFWGNLSLAQRLIHYDFIYFFVKGEFNWMPVPVFASSLYFAYQMYFNCSETNNGLLLSIIDESDTSFFLYPKTEGRQYVDEVIQGKMKVVYNLMQTVLVVFELTAIGVTIYLLVLFYLNIPSDDLPLFLLNLTFFIFSGVIYFCVLLYNIFLFSLIVPIAMAQLDTFLFKLKQTVAYLRRLEDGQLQWFHYRLYQKALLSVLVPFAEYNALYGQIFTVFLVCNVPVNAVFLVTFLHPGDVPLIGQVNMAAYSCVQMVAFFLMHLYLVSFPKHFHAPSYQLLRLYGQSLRSRKAFRRIGPIRVRLQIASSIQAFHTKRKYGLTYGKFGKVTLRSFITFLLIYGKFLMTIYRIFYL